MRRYAALYLGLCHAWGWSDTKSWPPLTGTPVRCAGRWTARFSGCRTTRRDLQRLRSIPGAAPAPVLRTWKSWGSGGQGAGTTGRVPADMSFEEWKRQLVQGIPRPKDVLTEYIQKAIPGQGLITYDAACNASQIKSRCSRLTRLASSWYSSLIVVGLMPVTLASSACVQRISLNFLDSKILIILCVAPLCDKITRIWPTCLAFVRLSRNGLFRAISLRI